MKLTKKEVAVNLVQLVAAMLMVLYGHPYIAVLIAMIHF